MDEPQYDEKSSLSLLKEDVETRGRPRSRPEAKYFKGRVFMDLPLPVRDEEGNLVGYEWRQTDLIKLLSNFPYNYTPFAEAEGYHFSTEEAEVVANFIINECVFPEGELTGLPFVPERWQWAIYLNTYCWFEDKNPSVRRFNEVFIYVPRKNGKDLNVCTPLPTPSGWTTMGDIEVGDTLFDKDGDLCTVTWNSPIRTPEKTYEVTFSSGYKVKACADHQWYIHSRKQHPKYKNKIKSANRKAGEKTVTNSIGRNLYEGVWTTQELVDTGVDCSYGKTFRIPMHDGIQTPEMDLPIDPYLLGYWLGDGKSSGPYLYCSDEDRSHFSNYEQIKERTCWKITVPELSGTVLNNNNLRNNKHIPPTYLRASRDQRLSLLQGLMDSDGTISKRGTDISIVQKNKTLAEQILDLVFSLGLKASMKEVQKKSQTGNGGTYYQIQFAAGRDTHPVFRLQRKLNRMKPGRKRSKSNHIVSIEPCKPCEMRCIEVNSPSGTYLFGEQYITTHNTAAFGAIPSLISLFVDPEKRSQNFCCAADTDQAALNFRHAAYMVESNSKMLNRLTGGRVRHGSRYMEHNNGKTLKVLSSIAETKHGLSPNYVGVDEVHAHSNSELIDVMVTGTAARKSPLTFYTTTADYDRPSVCNDLYRRAKAVAQGLQSEPNFLPVVYEAQPTDDWEDPEIWRLANPNFGISVNEKYFIKEINRVKNSPQLLNRFLRLHLNIRTSVETSWIYPHTWGATNPQSNDLLSVEEIRENMESYADWFSVVHTETWDHSNVDILLDQQRQYYTWFFKKIYDLQGETCYAGYDNAAVKDIASLALFFPDSKDLLSFNWVPADSIERRSVEEHIPYKNWYNCGLVNNTPQTTIDEDSIVETIGGSSGILHHFDDLRIVAFDNWGSNYISNQLMNQGLNCRSYPQSFAGMNQPCKTLESWVEQQNFFHGGHPVLAWMMGNTMLAQSNNDQIRPDRKNSTDKIDGIVAALMAIGAWLYSDEKIITDLPGLNLEEN